jgi:hypothetical protein
MGTTPMTIEAIGPMERPFPRSDCRDRASVSMDRSDAARATTIGPAIVVTAAAAEA